MGTLMNAYERNKLSLELLILSKRAWELTPEDMIGRLLDLAYRLGDSVNLPTINERPRHARDTEDPGPPPR